MVYPSYPIITIPVYYFGWKIKTEQFDTVISAVGIVGNIEGLGLDKLPIKTEKSHIKTNSKCSVGIEGIYAIGDVAGAPWLAHKASHEGVMVAELIAGKDVHAVDPLEHVLVWRA